MSARARLRGETAELHARVEARMKLPERLSCDAGYRALLERFFGFVEPLERELARVAWPADLAFPARLKTHHLARDLVRLGHTPASLAAAPRCRTLPALPSREAAFGCLYVLEGSTLGGRLILREVRATLGRDAESGAAYFAGYGARTGAMWSSFVAILDRSVEGPVATKEAIGAAGATFGALDRWLGRGVPLTSPGS